jgi:hypothetical protein
MKKMLIALTLMMVAAVSYAQETTMNAVYYKVKLGHRNMLNKAMLEHNAKFRPAGSNYAVVAFNLVGGEHNNEVLMLSNLGKSFKERDLMAPASKDAQDDLYANIHPHLEDITGGDVLVYKKEYSNSAFNDRAEKALTTQYFLKYTVDDEFWNVVKKLPAAWTKAGMKVAVYTPTTGSSRVFFTRRMPNGWSELDENKNLAKAYDEVYGAGTFDKDVKIFRSYVEKKDAIMMTLNKDMSSK